MRPRVFPAEDMKLAVSNVEILLRFNEAAGIPRGRPGDDQLASRVGLASMRPRVFPAEDARCGAIPANPPPCFNEAAGIPRGRRAADESAEFRQAGFNEAAGIPRGRRRPQGGGRLGHRDASMRPRVFPAEDACGSAAAGGCAGASMRPRVFPAEDTRRCEWGRSGLPLQ